MSDSMFYRLDHERLDGLLLQTARRENASVTTVPEARERLSGFTIADLAAVTGAEAPPHLGPITARLWELTYILFVGDGPIRTPSPFSPKSVLLSRARVGGGDKVNFLTVGGVDGVPLMVAFPPVSDSLLAQTALFTSFAESADALEEAAHAMTDRVNALVTAARALLSDRL